MQAIIVIIPRINLSPSIDEVPFHMTRRQFPKRPADIITISKSQCQSFKNVGFYHQCLAMDI